jgi:hypothetical protein
MSPARKTKIDNGAGEDPQPINNGYDDERELPTRGTEESLTKMLQLLALRNERLSSFDGGADQAENFFAELELYREHWSDEKLLKCVMLAMRKAFR